MSVFNRLFRTKAKISKAEKCLYGSNLWTKNGIELQLLHFGIKGKNFSIVIPIWAFDGIKEFQGPDGKTSLDLIQGCNVLFEIQSSSAYKANKRRLQVQSKIPGIKNEKDMKQKNKEMMIRLKKAGKLEKQAKDIKKQVEEHKKLMKKVK